MKKLELDKKKIKRMAKKAIPYIILGGVAAIGGVVAYKKGFANGIELGKWKGIDEFLSTMIKPNDFNIVKLPNGTSVFSNALPIHCTDDVKTAVKMFQLTDKQITEADFDSAVEQFTDLIFDGKLGENMVRNF